MKYLIPVAAVLVTLAALTALIAYGCYRLTFYSDRKREKHERYPMPVGKCYEQYYDKMKQWMIETEEMPCDKVEITAFDGVTLRGRYYECAPGGPVELMFPGYRGTARRDMCGGVQRCAALGHNALIVDQRGNGESDGNVITFGNFETRDCLSWIDFAIDRFGQDVKIILCGISMGASTVLITAGGELPKNVIGVLADCGFSSAREIIHKVMGDLKMPKTLIYPFIRLGARLYGGFSLEKHSAAEAVKTCRVPVIFFHGTGDDFVPWEMSQINYDNCASEKKLVLIPEAGHGICCMVDTPRYMQELRDFWKDKR